jgi:hypothetical protein
MGDMGEVFRDMTIAKKERHRVWRNINMKIIKECEIPFVSSNDGENISFRIGCLKYDFYPSTGRFRDLVKNKTYRGGAQKIIEIIRKKMKGEDI